MLSCSGLFSVKRNLKTTAELAYALVEQAVECTFEQLVEHVNADEGDDTCDTDQLVNLVASGVNAVNLDTEVAVDVTCCVI